MDNLEDSFVQNINFDDTELDPENENAIYGDETRLQLKSLRRTTELDIKPVLSYARFAVNKCASKSKSEREYVDKLRSFHDGLVFTNPLRKAVPTTDKGKLTIAMPPGMKNLGATCYLNTQLQCLAKNTVFLNGIFSWHPSSDKSHAMDSVLAKLQLLLARMVYGDQRTITTEEFSLALGLENNEMQDPNEFARLLFTRMHEAFVLCGEGKKASKEQISLSKLLPTLFEGTTTYKTTCSVCGSCRIRDESFMDLNLTIAHRRAASPGKDGQLKLKDAFAAGSDTDVQYCFDRYTKPEELVGENQYWCEKCQRKQDATRRVYLSVLPPVLNLQLCRYVFDRTKFAKKKLSDRVLLSRELRVWEEGDVRTAHRYILCAVMRHQGTSAYTGHYVAEALDWQTGCWFEFNDDVVKVLVDGPSNSISSNQEAYDESKWKKKKIIGSSDAYNMYYVQESFLAESAVSSLQEHSDPHILLPGHATETFGATTDVLSSVATERATRYGLLNE
jgi:ubiquitin carboxyl-terminal hydrolase 48